ncbi:HpcH/HpaI aldolase/citrate lyase family protein [Sinorhizobium mexicanum]|nr:CoA ester lyase [Sinorhizobium mexicanum]
MQRSFLFVPGDRPERFDKAEVSGADVVVLDLEDAVLPGRKAEARAAVEHWLADGRRAAVRINAVGSDEHSVDCALIARVRPAAVMLPKTETGDQIDRLAAVLDGEIPIIALIETALGIWNAGEIARAAGTARIAFGSVDLEAETGIAQDHEAMLHARSRLVLASAMSHKVAPIDGVTLKVDDAEALQADIRHARKLGFRGKLCIHPRQVSEVNRLFLPGEAEIAWARRVLAAAESAGHKGAFQLDGALIDRPVIDRATAILRSTTSLEEGE